ncbi:MAG: IMP dehydrogenase, partial [Candidatus Micrarchaeota archaeon]|nr:IMP dehydrogenase [Candidatus Micrarchaeota archaeon]
MAGFSDKPDKHSFTKKLSDASEAITFDDVLLQPGYSEVAIADIDVSTFVTRNLKIQVPIVSSPMDTVTEGKLAAAVAKRGGVGVVHYNIPIANQVEHVAFVKSQKLPVGAAVGPNDDERVSALLAKEVDFLVIDTA